MYGWGYAFRKVGYHGFTIGGQYGFGMKLDAVAVSSGPGSYTGLRIGVSVAKGLCFGYGIPLIGIHTLDILASAAIRKNKEEADCLYCAMLDARVWKSTLRFMIPISTRYVPRLLIS